MDFLLIAALVIQCGVIIVIGYANRLHRREIESLESMVKHLIDKDNDYGDCELVE